MGKTVSLIRKIPKGATIGIAFALTTYFYGKGLIGKEELDLISQIAMALGITGSFATRYNKQ